METILAVILVIGSIGAVAQGSESKQDRCVQKIIDSVPYASDSELLPGIVGACDDEKTMKAVLKCKTAKCVEEVAYAE